MDEEGIRSTMGRARQERKQKADGLLVVVAAVRCSTRHMVKLFEDVHEMMDISKRPKDAARYCHYRDQHSIVNSSNRDGNANVNGANCPWVDGELYHCMCTFTPM